MSFKRFRDDPIHCELHTRQLRGNQGIAEYYRSRDCRTHQWLRERKVYPTLAANERVLSQATAALQTNLMSMLSCANGIMKDDMSSISMDGQEAGYLYYMKVTHRRTKDVVISPPFGRFSVLLGEMAKVMQHYDSNASSNSFLWLPSTLPLFDLSKRHCRTARCYSCKLFRISIQKLLRLCPTTLLSPFAASVYTKTPTKLSRLKRTARYKFRMQLYIGRFPRNRLLSSMHTKSLTDYK